MRALRLGVLVGDKLIEERVIPSGGVVTIGQSIKATLSLPFDGVPLQPQPLFAQPVEVGAKGKLVFGEVVVLYQDVPAAPVAPKVTLPASVRGTLADRIDRKLALIIGASLVAHLGIGIVAWAADYDTGEAFAAAQPDRPYRAETYDRGLVINADQLPEPPPIAKPVEQVAAAVPKHTETPRPVPHTPTTVRPTTTRPVERAVDPNDFLGITTSGETGPNGHAESPARRTNTNLTDQVNDARNRNVTVGDTDRGTHSGNPARVGTGRDPVVDGPTGPTHTDKGTEELGPLPPTETPKKQMVSTLTADMVMARINASYQPGLRRCYEKGMRNDAGLSGKIRVMLVVGANGGVSAASANGVSDEVDSCVQNLMQTWTFDVPKGPDGKPTPASFRLSLALQSG